MQVCIANASHKQRRNNLLLFVLMLVAHFMRRQEDRSNNFIRRHKLTLSDTECQRNGKQPGTCPISFTWLLVKQHKQLLFTICESTGALWPTFRKIVVP